MSHEPDWAEDRPHRKGTGNLMNRWFYTRELLSGVVESIAPGKGGLRQN